MVNRMHIFCWIFWSIFWLILPMILGCISWWRVVQDGDLPVAGVLQSSLDMYGSKVGNEVEEDADVKAALLFLLTPFVWCSTMRNWFVYGWCSLWLCDVIILNSQDLGLAPYVLLLTLHGRPCQALEEALQALSDGACCTGPCETVPGPVGQNQW